MLDITQIDKNFVVQTELGKEDIRFYGANEAPFSLHGVSYEDGCYRRLPFAVARSVSEKVGVLSTHCAGGRVRFRTNSPYIAISAKMPRIGKMPHFALTGSAGFDLYEGGRYVKTFVPPFKLTEGFESLIEVGAGEMREYTIHFPLYSAVSELYIGLSDKAAVLPPEPYAVEKPIVYYGSSITQGGCASRPGYAYTNILSRRLNAEHINLGFSGSARGEDAMAEYISGLSMSAFVYDYDHNAPTPEHLEATHERMFLRIRRENPTLPILILARPKYYLNVEDRRRLEIIRATCDRAKAAGDENVYMLDGPALMALAGDEGTVDNCHPNDLGFAAMAKAVGPILREILKG